MEQIGPGHVLIKHSVLGDMMLEVDVCSDGDSPPILFTDNETNYQKLWGCPNPTAYTKDAFHDYIIDGKKNKQTNLLSIDVLRYVIYHW